MLNDDSEISYRWSQTTRIKCVVNERVKLDTSIKVYQSIFEPDEFREMIFEFKK